VTGAVCVQQVYYSMF